jgi:hypothetical protein
MFAYWTLVLLKKMYLTQSYPYVSGCNIWFPFPFFVSSVQLRSNIYCIALNNKSTQVLNLPLSLLSMTFNLHP